MRKTLFNAGFYESRRLRHDGLIDYMVKDTNGRKIYTKPFSIARKIFSVLGVLVMLGLAVATDSMVHHPSPEAPVETWGINLLPYWLFCLCWLLWFVARRINLHKKYHAKVPYTSTFNLILYLLWMMLSMNLFFISFVGRFMTIYGVVVFYSIILIIEVWLAKKRVASLKNRLYGDKENLSLAKQKQLIQLFIGFSGLLIAGWMVLKLLFPGIGEVRTDVYGVLMVIGMLFVVNVIVVGAMIVLFLPYSLYGYYRHKYSEEYRESEGKTLEEWYGKKYLKKHKELLKNE